MLAKPPNRVSVEMALRLSMPNWRLMVAKAASYMVMAMARPSMVQAA